MRIPEVEVGGTLNGADLGLAEGKIVGGIVVIEDPDGGYRAVSTGGARHWYRVRQPDAEVMKDITEWVQTASTVANL